jgi:hypothetical protein
MYNTLKYNLCKATICQQSNYLWQIVAERSCSQEVEFVWKSYFGEKNEMVVVMLLLYR